jgi:hypothetical protein
MIAPMRWWRGSNAGAARSFEAHGVRIAVYADRKLGEEIERLLPPNRREVAATDADHSFTVAGDPDGGYSVLSGDSFSCDSVDLPVALGVLDSEIRAAIAVRSIDKVFVHAGVVAVDDRAIVVPGPSFSGKTTLVAALVERGATYYSDEFALLDTDGLVHPYAKRLSVRPREPAPAMQRPAAAFGGVTGTHPVPVGMIVVTSYRPAGSWKPQQLHAGQGALALMSNAVSARLRPADCLAAARRAAEHAIVLCGERGEASDVSEEIIAQLSRASRAEIG